MKEKGQQVIKIIIGVVIVLLLYLIALNGRYEYLANNYVLDKWKMEIRIAEMDNLPDAK